MKIIFKFHEIPRLLTTKKVARDRLGGVNQKGVSVLLAIMILTSLMILTLTVSDIVLRVGKFSRRIGDSEIAYYAAETAVEKAMYEIENNRTIENLDGLSGNLSQVSADWDLAVTEITASSPYNFTLESGESFQLDLDFVGMTYPGTINISWTGTANLMILNTNEGTQALETSSPVMLNNLSSNFYTLRLTNTGAGASSVSIIANGNDLPIGISITGTGEFNNNQRIINVERNNYQIY